MCPFCNRPVQKSPQECPQCHVSYHPNCWRQVRYCLTCSLENPERAQRLVGSTERARPKASEAVTFTYDEYIKSLGPYLTVPGRAIPAIGIFLFLFRKASYSYLLLVVIGLFAYLFGYLIERTGGCQFSVSPSTRSMQQIVSLFGFTKKMKMFGFEDIKSFRIEGEQRFKGDQKGVPSYFYNAYWVVVITNQERHIRLTDEIRTDQDPSYVIGEEYEFSGLLPLARKAGAAVGVDVYVAPNIAPFQFMPLMVKSILLLLLLVGLSLFL